MTVKLTMSDICAVTNYSRHQVRALLESLPIYAVSDGSPRVAREFTKHDLLVLCVAAQLEQNYGLQRSAIAAVIREIYSELFGPRSANPAPLLHLTIVPPTATYLAERQDGRDGITIALQPIFEKVESHLGLSMPLQQVLFPAVPAILAARKK